MRYAIEVEHGLDDKIKARVNQIGRRRGMRVEAFDKFSTVLSSTRDRPTVELEIIRVVGDADLVCSYQTEG